MYSITIYYVPTDHLSNRGNSNCGRGNRKKNKPINKMYNLSEMINVVIKRTRTEHWLSVKGLLAILNEVNRENFA